MLLNGSAPTNKRNGLAISRIDGVKTASLGMINQTEWGEGGGVRGRAAAKAGEGEKGLADPETVTRTAAGTPRVTRTSDWCGQSRRKNYSHG